MKKHTWPHAWIASAIIGLGGLLISGCDSTTQSPAATTVAIPPPPATAPESEGKEVIPLTPPAVPIAQIVETTPTVPTPTANPRVEVPPGLTITDVSAISCAEGLRDVCAS